VAPRIPSGDQLTNARPVYCLDLTFGGVEYHLATEPVDVERDGRVIHYTEALSDPDYLEEVTREGMQASNSVPLAVFLDGVDIAAEVNRGHRLESVAGHLFFVLVDRSTGRTGQTYAERFALLTGRLSQPVYADPERSAGYLAFTLDDNPGDDSSLLLDAAAVVSDATWPNAPAVSGGKVYPVVIGTPGSFRKPDGTLSTTSGSPAYPLAISGSNYTKLLIAGHDVEATSVTVFDGVGTSSQTFSVTRETDGLGRLVATVDISSPGAISAKEAEYWVVWDNGGGIGSPFASTALEGLGDVCAWALLRTSLRVDVPKWIAEAGILNRVKVATYITEPTLSPWSFVARILDSMLVEVRAGPSGLYPMGRVLDTAMAEGLALITEGPEFEPVGPVTGQTQLGDVINAVTVQFAIRGKTGDYKRRVTLTPDPDSTDPEQFSDEYATISANRWSTDPEAPIIQAESIDLDHIYDDTSAALIARERVRTQGLGYSERPYLADARFGYLMPGDQVRLDSESLGRVFLATVLSKRWTGYAWGLSLALDDDPVRISSL